MTDTIDYFGTGSDAGGDSFLSNFFEVPGGVAYADERYPTVEHAYQAAKTTDTEARKKIMDAPTPSRAKHLGRAVQLRVGWDRAKLDVMHVLLDRKFATPYMARLLIATAPTELIEGNYWHDNFWGDCRFSSRTGAIAGARRQGCGQRKECERPGHNYLGELLMSVRCAVQREYATG